MSDIKQLKESVFRHNPNKVDESIKADARNLERTLDAFLAAAKKLNKEWMDFQETYEYIGGIDYPFNKSFDELFAEPGASVQKWIKTFKAELKKVKK